MRKKATLGLVLKSILFILAVFAAYSQFTDADLFDQEAVTQNALSATTLDLTTLDTANESTKTLFFSVTGMIQNGFQVESVRLKNSGALGFPYTVTTQETGGSSLLCQSLDLVVLQEWTPIFSGKLLSLELIQELTVTENWEDLVFVISLPQVDATLKNQTCSFNFTFTSSLPSSSFSDTEVLQNSISTGTWAE